MRSKPLSDLAVVVGNIGSEIAPRTVGFPERPVDIVAELGRTEQGLRRRLPILRFHALGRLEDAGIDEALGFQFFQATLDTAGFHHLAFRTEHVLMDAYEGKIVADDIHHPVDRETADLLERCR